LATELPPAIARFVADVSQYTEPLQKAIDATRQFGDRTDSAALKAREMGLKTMEAADQAAAAMKIAQDAAEKYERGEIDLAAAQRAAADAARSQARADIELAALQDAVAAATKNNANEQANLKKKTDDAKDAGFMEMGMLQKIWLIAGFATGSLEPLAAGLIAITGGLASGLASAGLGLGAFGVVAKSAFTQVTNANTAGKTLTGGLGELQRSLKTATKEWDAFVSHNSSGVAKIMSQGIGLLPSLLKTVQMFIKPAESGISRLIGLLSKDIKSSGFASVMKTLASNSGDSIFKLGKAIADIVGGIGHLLATFAPFAQVVLTGLDKMTGGFDKWAGGLSKTKGFSEFMTMVKTQGPTIVKTLENLVKVAGYFIKDMAGSASNMLWLKVIPQLSGLAAAFMKTHSGMVEFAMNLMLVGDAGKKVFGVLSSGYSTVATTAKNLNNLSKGFNDAAKAADEATGSWGTAGGKLKYLLTGMPFKDFKKGMNDAEYAASDASGVMGTLGGNVTKAFEAIKSWTIWTKIAAAWTKVWTGVQWAFDAAMDAMPIILVVTAIAALVAAIIYAYIHFKVFRDVVNEIGRVLKTAFFDALHGVEKAVMDVVNFVKEHWPLIVGFLLGPIALVAALIYTNWDTIKKVFDDALRFIKSVITTNMNDAKKIFDDVMGFIKSIVSTNVDDVKSVLSWFASLPGKMRGWWDETVTAVRNAIHNFLVAVHGLEDDVIHTVSSAGKWLYDAGRAVVMGLIQGIGSMVSDAVGAVEHLGGDIKSGFMDAIHALSPSKDFADIGNMITAGLALGINSTGQQAVDEARILGRLVTAAAFTGAITASQEASLKNSITSALATALKGGVQTALASGVSGKIGAATISLLKTIWDAVAGQDITRTQASSMATWVKDDNARLQALAVKRNAIAKEIAAAQAFATSTSQAAQSSYNLSSAATDSSGNANSVGGIISTLQGDVTAIRKFSFNIRKLAREGLNKSYISQLIAMGPASGGALAQELADANLSQIKSINTAENQVTAASNALGDNAAEIMYNTGNQAGKGFLSGLKSQEKAIENVMSQIAASMVSRLRKDLGIASPSRVMMEHGMMAAEGFAQGLENGVTRVSHAASALASAASSGAASSSSRSSITSSQQTITINLRNEITGKMNEKEVWSALQQQTFRYNIRNTGIVTGAVRPGLA
jgi:phage-related protein